MPGCCCCSEARERTFGCQCSVCTLDFTRNFKQCEYDNLIRASERWMSICVWSQPGWIKKSQFHGWIESLCVVSGDPLMIKVDLLLLPMKLRTSGERICEEASHTLNMKVKGKIHHSLSILSSLAPSSSHSQSEQRSLIKLFLSPCVVHLLHSSVQLNFECRHLSPFHRLTIALNSHSSLSPAMFFASSTFRICVSGLLR